MVNPIAIAGCLAIGFGGLAFAFIGGDSRADKRRAAVARTDAKALGASASIDRTARKKQIADGLRDIEMKGKRRVNLATRIEQAGLSITKQQYWIGSLLLGLVCSALTYIQSKSLLLTLLVAVTATVGLPQLTLARLRIRRINKFIANFPTAIDIIVRGIKSGLPLGDTIRIAATESPEPVKSEFRRIVEALSLGLTLPEAIERMAQRVPIAETNFFSIVIAIQGQSGGNLSEALGNLSRVLRERKKMKGKITAMSMEAKASAAIIGAVPFLVVGALYVSSPKYISLLWTTSHGKMISVIAICWMAIGIAMMKKMISFDFQSSPPMLDEIAAKFSDAHFMAVLFAAIGTAATVLTAAMPWLQPDTLSRRIKAVSSERERIRARERERLQAAQNKTSLRVKPSGLVKELVETLNLSSWLSTEKAKMQLAMAGFRGARAEYAFLAFRLAAPIAFFILAIVYQFLIIKWSQPAMIKIGIAIAASYLGIKAPELFLKNKTTKRQKELERAFPNTLDLLLICAESGVSIEHAVRKVSQEIGIESISMAEEMGLLAAEMSYLADRRIAFENLGLRTGLESVRSLTTVLSQSERYGTPLGAALRVLSQESRDQRMAAAEKKAAALPPTLTVPMILFFLPGLFAAILTPAIVQINNWN